MLIGWLYPGLAWHPHPTPRLRSAVNPQRWPACRGDGRGNASHADVLQNLVDICAEGDDAHLALTHRTDQRGHQLRNAVDQLKGEENQFTRIFVGLLRLYVPIAAAVEQISTMVFDMRSKLSN